VFGALLAPAALSLLTTTFTDLDERGKAFGIFGAIGAAVGLLLGRALTENISWRWCLYINVAFAAPAAVGVGAIRCCTTRRAKTGARLDIPGSIRACLGLLARRPPHRPRAARCITGRRGPATPAAPPTPRWRRVDNGGSARSSPSGSGPRATARR
jgi:MFS family permease